MAQVNAKLKLPDKVALVTGASRGIGRAAALALAAEGADVAVNYESRAAEAEEVAEAIRRMGRRALAVKADVADAAAVRRAVSETLETLGRIDILVNNAGIDRYTPFLQITEAEWDRVVDVVLKGSFLVSQEVARHMVARRSGRILNIASVCSFVARPDHAHYSAAKAGIVMLTRCMAVELAPHGIVVNAIAPGSILTDMNRGHWSDPERRARRLQQIPLGRIGEPEDLAPTIVHLVSEDARYTTGAVLMMDGGDTAV